ncbi:Gfo/Idh/MocA family oxidoreductase [Paeniglutamicibacter psychrophenolicus]|uniref:Gfo/Idh/MocA family oxidoreductase n=1 Tax=Paeniglutamicibacter psychrophenolicus TaxID=257454 RepID=UPI0027867AA0|nr:Gfo/Idh/MocA family oxidoreductase [Paeniglutamicibacter psychrophenolicus]MDQ0092248.1 myo-inositol 2-dehydrogenase/D-chiro-inositol 1-dehydrogenase [Paeniglutamicibacter psychrophenolicus]
MAYSPNTPPIPEPIRIAVIGCGWIGAFHARSLAGHLPGVRLEAVADPAPGAAAALATELGIAKHTTDPVDLFADPEIDGVLIAAPSAFHATLITQAAAAGKHVFSEKPAGLDLAELEGALDAVDRAGVEFQIGFNRRFAADFTEAKNRINAGDIGSVQLMRSLTRDPGTSDGIAHAARIKPNTIFLETLIHDFDTLNWFNEGARVTEVRAMADALVEPSFKDGGLLDTAVVTLRYDNGAIAVAEASFSALYGYDVRGEVFGSAGMATAGHPVQLAAGTFTAAGAQAPTERLNIELFAGAYRAELAHFAQLIAARNGHAEPPTAPTPGAQAARDALEIALACVESMRTGEAVRLVRETAGGAR